MRRSSAGIHTKCLDGPRDEPESVIELDELELGAGIGGGQEVDIRHTRVDSQSS
jgi:hypothetical protein